MPENKDCLFCKIVDGKIPSKKIYEDENIIAFNDINPAAPTHILFVPKKHFDSLSHVPENALEVMVKIFSAIQKVTVKNGLSKEGFRTIINTGEKGGQTVFHIHVHVLGGKTMDSHLG